MPGIRKISQRREEEKASQQSSGLELWLSDGDVARVSIIATGDDEDTRLDDFWAHSLQTTSDSGKTIWASKYCERMLDEDKPCLLCEKGNNKPGHKFGFWCFVHEVFHGKQGNEEWEEIVSPTGAKKYRESVNEFRIFTRGFGSRDYLWNQLVDIYNEDDALNKWVTRIARKGSGKDDTNYVISATRDKVSIPKEMLKDAMELTPIREFFQKRYNSQTMSSGNKEGSSQQADSNNDLSFLDDDTPDNESKDEIDKMFEGDSDDSGVGDLF